MINLEQHENKFSASILDKNGVVQIITLPIEDDQRYQWKISPSRSEYRNWDGQFVKKEKTKRLNKYRVIEFLTDQPPEIQDLLFTHRPPKKFFCDIETEYIDEFPDPATAKYAVWTIAFCGENDLMYVMGTKSLPDEKNQEIENQLNDYFKAYGRKIRFKYLCFADEISMLTAFFTKYYPKMPFLTGWNFIDFDWTYLLNRLKRLNLNLVSDVDPRTSNPKHQIVVDYKLLYDKWDKSVLVKENGTLDFVSKEILGVQKLKFSMSLKDLYRNDYTNYVFYNAIDTYLVRLMDQKLDLSEIFLQLGCLSRVEAQRAFSPVAMTESLFCRTLYLKKKMVVVDDFANKAREKYSGGFVKPIQPGIYRNTACFDFSSLYPTIMRQWNMSPETFIGRRSKIERFGDHELIAANGAVFTSKEDGAMKIFLSELFNQRKEAKNKAREIELLIEKKK